MPAASNPLLLLMAYECDPTKGSEAYVGWGRVLQAVREFEVHVICSEDSYAAVQAWKRTNELPRATFHTPAADSAFRLLRRIPRLFAYNYVAYQQWQRLAFRLALRLHRQHHFALVHQVNVCTFREPGYTWKLGIPFLWGPVGGTQNFPDGFLRALPRMERFKERARSATNSLSLRKVRVRRAAAAAKVLLAANSTNQRDFEDAFGREAGLLLETGLYGLHPVPAQKFMTPGPLEILWSGEFRTRKALPLLLAALHVLKPHLDFRLKVLGKGPLEDSWKSLTRRLGLEDRVTFVGHVPLDEAVGHLSGAQLFVFTSLRDTSGNVVLEALSYGVPVICFDHQGVGDIVTPECGIKIAVTTPEESVDALAKAIRNVAQDRQFLAQLSHWALERAAEFLWSTNGDVVNAMYRRLAGIEGRE